MANKAVWGIGLVSLLAASAYALEVAAPAVASSKTTKVKVPRPAKPGLLPTLALPPLSEAQLQIARKVVLGSMPCELGARVSVAADPREEGRFVLAMGRQTYFMAPVVTATGAVRLEDLQSGAMWLQLANKSMLLDQRLGRRLADACMSPEQARVAQALLNNPAPGLLDPVPRPEAVPVSASVPDKASTE